MFSADGVSWCLTSSSRSWQRDDGVDLSPQEAGYLNGFRPDYPWQGSRSARFRQAGDVVNPIVARLMLGEAIGVDVGEAVSGYAAGLYHPLSPQPRALQPAVEAPGVAVATPSASQRGVAGVGLW